MKELFGTIKSHTTPILYNLLVVLFGLGIGLYSPDIDQSLLAVLHHRSIVTHSILLPWLIMFFIGPSGFMAGIFAGISIHLSADLLSPAIGYGAIWLPYPIKMSLGPLSYLWLLGNAFLGVLLAFKTTPLKWLLPFPAILVGFLYAFYNEERLMAFGVFLIVFATTATYFYRRSKQLEG